MKRARNEWCLGIFNQVSKKPSHPDSSASKGNCSVYRTHKGLGRKGGLKKDCVAIFLHRPQSNSAEEFHHLAWSPLVLPMMETIRANKDDTLIVSSKRSVKGALLFTIQCLDFKGSALTRSTSLRQGGSWVRVQHTMKWCGTTFPLALASLGCCIHRNKQESHAERGETGQTHWLCLSHISSCSYCFTPNSQLEFNQLTRGTIFPVLAPQ